MTERMDTSKEPQQVALIMRYEASIWSDTDGLHWLELPAGVFTDEVDRNDIMLPYDWELIDTLPSVVVDGVEHMPVRLKD